MLSVSLPIDVVVLKLWVTETKVTSLVSKTSTSLEKSVSERDPYTKTRVLEASSETSGPGSTPTAGSPSCSPTGLQEASFQESGEP
jgi:hypothetical protein